MDVEFWVAMSRNCRADPEAIVLMRYLDGKKKASWLEMA